ncbi:hypothetical protein J4E86_011472 [Alternaria arbusti]|uniref:uncharacterized protein n=1 Tax=Alternaria arbusti TaxID=232088 RepID=UPI00221FF95D|nr:uncharacterized protein J4E86_011472 [Alternaria arbusti]KAI4934090.1 hypothetical protein J4E86_011472 [Alternaria arbusti]
MRLLYIISDGNFRFTEDIIRTDKIPPYAILSHTWGDEEVVFNDVKTFGLQDIATKKKGAWEKIRFCARQAKLDGLEHFWVDTCCIDRANHTELSEAINSMFRWYQKADKCYVYLPDVKGKSSAEESRPSSEWEAAFRVSRWFTRGWTLQELLAPRSVEFFSADGARLGDKDSLNQTIHEVTQIPIEALSGSDLSNFDVTERFSWAQKRQTTREEDGAYCLLGIVDCPLPLIYGEGKENALKRLRKEMQGREEKISQIRSWLSAPDPSMNYLKAHKQRQAGTGLWLLQNETFEEWKEDPASRLWLHGIPGCGKTILSSTVVEHLQHHCGDDKRKMTVYFYFDFNDAQKQVPELMLRSLLRQLLQRSVTIPVVVDALFSSCKDGKEQPSLQALLKVTPEAMRQFSHVYVVIDALDESAKRVELMELLETLAGWQLDMSHLLMTSRKERDIEMSLNTFVLKDNMICLQRGVVDADILRFVQQKLSDDKRLAKWNKNAEVRQEVETALMRGAQGMFRWATCQLDVIAECRNLSMLRKSLATLPQTLDQTYDRILTAIKEEDRMYTIRILQWLTFSARPLSLEEVAEVAAIDVAREPAFDCDEVLVDPLEALEICSSLVTVKMEESDSYRDWILDMDQDYYSEPEVLSGIVTLAHYSVQEYLVSERIKLGPAKQYSMTESGCHKAMTIGCLGYLNRFQGPLSKELYNRSPLAGYCAKFWIDHFHKTPDRDEEMSRLVISLLLTDKHVLANSIRIYDPYEGDLILEEPYEDQDDSKEMTTSLHYASFLGLETVTKLLLDQDVDVNAQPGPYGSALFTAVSQGHMAVVELLINAKADVNLGHESVLNQAFEWADVEMVNVLIDAGADVNTLGDDGYPIQIASWRNDEVLVKKLLDANADINARDEKGLDALMWALFPRTNEAVVKLLIDAGADVNTRNSKDGSALILALRRWNTEERKKLWIDDIADANERDSEHRSSLRSLREFEAVVKLLIDAGADVNWRDNQHSSALTLALSKWEGEVEKLRVVKLLIDAGADANARDSEHGSALQIASHSGNEAMVRLLIEAGADVDAPSANEFRDEAGTYCDRLALIGGHQSLNALQIASAGGHTAVVKLLLDAGADIDAEGGTGRKFVGRHGPAESAKLALINRILRSSFRHLSQLD